MLRKVLSIVCGLLFLLFGYMALTVPMVAAAGPAVLMFGCGVVAWYLWPKHRQGAPS